MSWPIPDFSVTLGPFNRHTGREASARLRIGVPAVYTMWTVTDGTPACEYIGLTRSDLRQRLSARSPFIAHDLPVTVDVFIPCPCIVRWLEALLIERWDPKLNVDRTGPNRLPRHIDCSEWLQREFPASQLLLVAA